MDLQLVLDRVLASEVAQRFAGLGECDDVLQLSQRHFSRPEQPEVAPKQRVGIQRVGERAKRDALVDRVCAVVDRLDMDISVAEAAELLGISRIAVFKKIQKGQLPAVKMGRSYAIDRLELVFLINLVHVIDPAGPLGDLNDSE